ncbi:hypothetical protein F4561_003763 [Lipingzhangella halophila]|uniref:Uncharacterized protein n=1 Tax=Lipingzhangella halophila TaxID=1783352 RepID=A0A7W7RJ42_9ACTN|nr:hypothetical protein [Lipingzhangella halophila]MBB4932943.1 hypothetical protein [Lipingzhangella halophila]
MTDSDPAKVPSSPPGVGTTARAAVYGTVLLGATVAITLGMPEAHGLSPGTALAVVAVSLVWGALQAPLTVRWVRAKRLAERIRRQLGSYQSSDPARDTRERKRIQAEAGVSEWWELEWCSGIVPGVLIATVAAFLLHDGPNNWFGTWTWAAAALPALWTIGSASRHVLMDRIAEAQPANKQAPGFNIITVLFGFPLMLVLPSTAVLFLTASGAVRFMVTGIETYRSRKDRGRELRTALQTIGGDAVERRAAAVAGFLAEASPRLVQREREVVLAELERIVVERPGRVMRILSRTPHLATAEAITPVIRSWACGTDASDFDDAWEALETLCGGAAPAHERLAAALAGAAPEQVSAEFRRKAAGRIFGDIDADTDAHPYPGAPAWSLLETLSPNGAPATPGDWWCALAETAAERGDVGEARRRFQKAIYGGCDTARYRLAYHVARAGHRALTGGDPGTAVGLLTEAVRLEDALDYRLLLLLAQEAHGGEPGAAADPVTTADTLEPWSGEAWTSAAMLRLLRGDTTESAHLLRGAEGRLRAANPEAAGTAPAGSTACRSTPRPYCPASSTTPRCSPRIPPCPKTSSRTWTTRRARRSRQSARW